MVLFPPTPGEVGDESRETVLMNERSACFGYQRKMDIAGMTDSQDFCM